MLALLAAAACSAGPPVARPAPAPPPSSAAPVATDGCPAVPATGNEMATVDYVDFIVIGTTTYLADREVVERSGLGEVVMRSRCSFRELNDRTGRMTPPAQNGDTGFLPPGTPVYSVHGWPVACRVAAESDGRLQFYLAQQSGGDRSQPVECAVG
ncbi:hypothetical protein GCM10009608_16480 [Pseudonocardia alaniniphila]